MENKYAVWVKAKMRLPDNLLERPVYIGGELKYMDVGSNTLNLKFDGVPGAGRYIKTCGMYENCFAIDPHGIFNEKDFDKIEWLDETTVDRDEVVKEVAVDFFWECRMDVQKHGYQEVIKMFANWFKDNKYFQNKLSQPSLKGDAVEFAEWIRKRGYEPLAHLWYLPFTGGGGDNEGFTTQQLYNLFKQRK